MISLSIIFEVFEKVSIRNLTLPSALDINLV